ncbi:neugrin [Pholidichthys leucotaenia]
MDAVNNRSSTRVSERASVEQWENGPFINVQPWQTVRSGGVVSSLRYILLKAHRADSMARSLLFRFGSLLPVTSFVSTTGCRCASRGWPGQSHGDAGSSRARPGVESFDEELEDVEDKLQDLTCAVKRKQKTVKYHMLRRQMTPRGAPQRRLTRDAMEQIRYLKEHQPQEWTVDRLAEGFSITPDVVLRVLRSKFIPSPERKAKQDAKAVAAVGQQVLLSGAGTQQVRVNLPMERPPATLPSGSTDGALVPVSGQTQVIRGESLRSRSEHPVAVTAGPATRYMTGFNDDETLMATAEDGSSTDTSPAEEEEEEEEEESWDGQVFTEEELEEFMKTKKPSPAVQVGNDFFDPEGNFLYRI